MKHFNIPNLTDFSEFCIDAAGVIYTDYGVLAGVPETIHQFHKAGTVFLISNNSYMYPTYITARLAADDIQIKPDHIISSGHGLSEDKAIHAQVKDKVIYLVGEEETLPYAHEAGVKAITKQLSECDVIVLAAYLRSYPSSLVDDIIEHCQKYPDKPIICCNCDRYIFGTDALLPVVGFYADQINKAIPQNMQWFGKPLENFSLYVKRFLARFNITPSKQTIFFDDNIENVVNMQAHLGISGCWIQGTGIHQKQPIDQLISTYGQPDYIVPSLASVNNY